MAINDNNSILTRNNAIIETLIEKASQINTNENSSEGAQIFTSLEELNNDSKKFLNKIGIVYTEQFTYLTPGAKGGKFYFPEELDVKFTKSSYGHFYANDRPAGIGHYPWVAMMSVDASPTSIQIYMDVMISAGHGTMVDVNYSYNEESGKFIRGRAFDYLEDGLTFENNWFVLPEDNYIECPATTDPNNEALKVLIIGGHALKGLYEALPALNENEIKYVTNYINNEFTYETHAINNAAFLEAVDVICPQKGYSGEFVFNFDDNDIMTSIDCYVRDINDRTYLCIWENKVYVTTNSSNTTTAATYVKHHYDVATKQLTTTNHTTTSLTTGTNTKQMLADITGMVHATVMTLSATLKFGTWSGRSQTTCWVTAGGTNECDTGYAKTALAYQPLDMQFTVNNDNQLFPGVIALGSDGEHTGNGEIWNIMPDEQFRSMLYDTDPLKDNNLRSSLIKIEGVSGLNAKNVYGLDYDLNEDTNEDYVYGQNLLKLTTGARTAPESGPSSTAYPGRHLYTVSRDEVYLFQGYNSSDMFAVYKYHFNDDNQLVFDYSATSNFSVTSFLYQQPICRYKDGIIYLICATGTNYTTGQLCLITFNTSTRVFTKVRTCSTSSFTNGALDYDVDTQICYFHNASNLYKWNTSGTSATSIATDTYYSNYSGIGDGVVEYIDSKYFAIMGASGIKVIERATGAVSTVKDTSGKYPAKPSRGRFIEVGNYMYIFGYRYESSTYYRYIGKINLTTMTVEKSANPEISMQLRGRSKNSIFILEDQPDLLYILTNTSYHTSSGGNNTQRILVLDTNTLEVKQLPITLGSNCGVIFGLENYDTSYILPKHSFDTFNFDEYSYYQNNYKFLVSNITDFLHNDIPLIYYSSSTGYINPNNLNAMNEYFNR